MAQVINTNVMSLNAQRNLNTSSASMATTIQRLSSGLRINSAKDDAAGLAISERFTTQIRGLDVAQRNANDGISLAQTAEGALGTIGDNLQRIRELAVQSRNATNSDSDREALQAEVTQLKSEIDRVAKQTSFNGTNLLDGSFTNKTFQVGANQGQTIDIAQIANAKIGSLGSWTSANTAASYTAGAGAVGTTTGGTPVAGGTGAIDLSALAVDGTTGVAAFTISINGGAAVNIAATAFATDDATTQAAVAAKIASAINGVSAGTASVNGTNGTIVDLDNTAGTAALSVTAAGGEFAAANLAAASTTGGTTAFAAGSFSLNGTTIEFGEAGSAASRASDLVKAINKQTDTTGVTASLIDGKLSLKSADRDITIAAGAGGAADADGLLAETGLAVGGSANTTTKFVAGSGQTGFADLDISTEEGSDNAILAMDAALNQVNSARADLGAIQNRFTSVVSNLSTTSENLTDSRSRIRDADYAKETAELTRTQILQQAGTAMLAQAKSVPQSVLSLLQ